MRLDWEGGFVVNANYRWRSFCALTFKRKSPKQKGKGFNLPAKHDWEENLVMPFNKGHDY